MPQKVVEISPSVTKGRLGPLEILPFQSYQISRGQGVETSHGRLFHYLKAPFVDLIFFFSWLTIKDFWWKAFAWNTLKISGIAKDLLAVTRLMLGSAAEEREKMQINPLTPTISY